MNQDVKEFVEELFAVNTLNRLPEQYGGGRIFDTPVIGVAKGDDPIFLKFKEVVGPEHLTPGWGPLACMRGLSVKSAATSGSPQSSRKPRLISPREKATILMPIVYSTPKASARSARQDVRGTPLQKRVTIN